VRLRWPLALIEDDERDPTDDGQVEVCLYPTPRSIPRPARG